MRFCCPLLAAEALRRRDCTLQAQRAVFRSAVKSPGSNHVGADPLNPCPVPPHHVFNQAASSLRRPDVLLGALARKDGRIDLRSFGRM